MFDLNLRTLGRAARRLPSARRSWYDHAVVGASTSGCILAARLAAQGYRVLLVDAEAQGRRSLGMPPWFRAQTGHRESSKPAWAAEAASPAIWAWGHATEYDRWAGLSGDNGWRFAELAPYILQCEERLPAGGFWTACVPGEAQNVLTNACAGLGYDVSSIPGLGPASPGLGRLRSAAGSSWRHWARQAYLQPALEASGPDGQQLEFIPGTRVLKVDFEGSSCVGVSWEGGGVRAGNVVLCGGALSSAHLLLASGVGPRKQLESLGIAVAHDLPGVGANVQDHVAVTLAAEYNQGLVPKGSHDMGDRPNFGVWLQGMMGERGLVGTTSEQIFGGRLHSPTLPNVGGDSEHLMSQRGSYEMTVRLGSSAEVSLRPLALSARGHLRLSTGNPRDAPRLSYDPLAHELDKGLFSEGMIRARGILAALAPFEMQGQPLQPQDATQDKAGLLRTLSRSCVAKQSYVGSCAMGLSDMAVVDGQLRVHGAQGLRVVDASVMPSPVASDPGSSVAVLAERAAQMLIAEQELRLMPNQYGMPVCDLRHGIAA